MTLYEIEDRISMIASSGIDIETGEVLEPDTAEFEAVINELEMFKADKVDDIAFAMKKQKSEIQYLKDAEKEISRRRKNMEYRHKWMNEQLRGVVAYAEGGKIKGHVHSMYMLNTQSVQVSVEPDELPEEYQKTTITAKAAELKKAIKAGAKIEGVALQDNHSLVIR